MTAGLFDLRGKVVQLRHNVTALIHAHRPLRTRQPIQPRVHVTLPFVEHITAS